MSPKAEKNEPDSENISNNIRIELEATRRDFHNLLDDISEEDFNKPSLNPSWTIAEMLYHLSVAPRNLPSDVLMIRHLKWVPKLPAGPFNRLNVYFTRRGARNATKKSLAEAYDEAHLKSIKALESVKVNEWEFGVEYPDWDPMLNGFVTLETLFHYIKRHFDSHAVDIRQALGMEIKSSIAENPNG